MAQSGQVADMLTAACPDLQVERVPIVTTGDRVRGPLVSAGGKGLFTRELEKALLEEQIDFAVHSAKDLPGQMSQRFCLASIPPREDPRDALVCREGLCPDQLTQGDRIGTGSSRRAMLAGEMFPGVEILPIRGNVETRLARVLRGNSEPLDAVILAMAGLRRCGLIEAHRRRIFPLCSREFTPAGGQGVLALQTLSERVDLIALLGRIEEDSTRQALQAERTVVARLEADCHSCLAVHITPFEEGGWQGYAMAGDPTGGRMLRSHTRQVQALQVADALYGDLADGGAGEWFSLPG